MSGAANVTLQAWDAATPVLRRMRRRLKRDAWHARVEAAARAMLDNPEFMAKHDGCTSEDCHVIALFDVLHER